MTEFTTRTLIAERCLLDTIKIVDLGDAGLALRDAAPALSVDMDMIGRILAGRYVVHSLLGRGGMGAVFKALDLCRVDLPEAKRYVAVKVLHQNSSERPTLPASLRREFYCAQALAHPNIVQVYETDCDGDQAFFTMELLAGELLSTVINRTRPDRLPRPYVWSIIRDVGAGLAHAHVRHVVHGDLKPQNIMITNEGEVRILDFGSSGARSRRPTATELLQRDPIPAATPPYTCCELLDGQQTDARDDLFALACIAYELLSGQHPFQGRDASEARDLGLSPECPLGLSLRQWRTLQQGLAWHRDDRSIEVRAWLTNLGVTVTPARLAPAHADGGVKPRPWRSAPVRRAALYVAAIVSVSAALSAGLASWRADTASRGPIQHAQDAAAPGAELPIGSAPSSVVMAPAVARASAPIPAPRASRRSVSISAKPLTVSPGAGFAEVSVVRFAAAGATSFTWWTEPSSAKPNRDFVPQPPTTQTFSNGRRTMKLFVRVLRNQSRRNAEMLYVVIGKPAGGGLSRPMARAAIWIPSQAGAMVASN